MTDGRDVNRGPQRYAAFRVALATLLVSPLLAMISSIGDGPLAGASPGMSPLVRYGHAMVYDAARGEVVLFGGSPTGAIGTGVPGDTWVWDGTTWELKTPPVSPPARVNPAMAYDAARSEVVLFGGTGIESVNVSAMARNDTWVWDGATWTEKAPATSPSPRPAPAMAYDAARGEVVLFGGNSGLGDTWVWNGTNWWKKWPTTSPFPRSNHAMAYDAARQEVVLFGGGVGSLSDTWVWNGTNWTEKSSTTKPPARDQHAMAYDATRGEVVLFGGRTRTEDLQVVVFMSPLSDTWLWDGTTWTEKAPATSPPDRNSHAMAYDAARGEVVLFGGNSGLSDTWVWDGATWSGKSTISTVTTIPSVTTTSVPLPPTTPEPTAVMVSPPGQARTVGEAASVTALVVDQYGEPVDGAGVTFIRSGSNPGSETVITNADGEATHSWVGAPAAPGGDVVEARAAGAPTAVGAAIVAWRPDPFSTYATEVLFDPPVATTGHGSTATVAFKAFRQDGSPFANGTVRYGTAQAGETPAFPSSVVTDAQGRGSIEVTPTAAEPVWQVFAYADEEDAGTTGVQDPSELTGAAAVIGISTSSSNTAPDVPALRAPADEGEFAPDDVQQFTVRASDPDSDPYSATIVVKDADTEAVVVTFETTPAPSEQDSTGAPVPPLGPGEYTWSATATDATGSESEESQSRSFTVLDNQAPSVPVLVAPDHDRWFSLTDAQTFTVSSTDPDDDPYSATVTVRDAGTNAVVATLPTTAAASGADSTGAPAPPLSPGEYTWTARAKDVEGHESDESGPRTFTVGNRAPTVPTLLSPKPAETLSTEGLHTFMVSATDADGDAYTSTITVRNSGGSVVTTFPTTAAPSGEDATGVPTVLLPAGSYTWTAKSEDVHGAESSESDPRAFNVSVNRPPEVPALVSPANGEKFHVNDPQVFTIQAVDPEGAPYSGTVTITGTASTSFETSVAPSGGQSSGAPTVPLPPGSYTWQATATDVFGVTGPPSVSRSFTVSLDLSPTPAALPAPGPTTRASVDSAGGQANNWSLGTSISSDGQLVAFSSNATNLAPTASNGRQHVFVRDRITGITEHVSVSSLAAQGNNDSWSPSISGDGRFVAFESYATNLVASDTNGTSDVFVHDRITKQTQRVSVSSSGAQANGSSWLPSISGDGRYVAFQSNGSNLVSGDTNGVSDVFVRDLTAGTTQRVSVSSSGAQATPGTWWFGSSRASISADGRYVAFESDATNLVSGDTNGILDVFVRDRTAGTTQRVSVSSSGAQGDGFSFAPGISADGQFVAFRSRADTLVSGGGNGWDQIYVRDRAAGTTTRVSASSSGVMANGVSGPPSISGDGRYVVFSSRATNLVAGDRNGVDDVFLRDRSTGSTTLVSHEPDGLQGNGDSGSGWPPSISDDGLHVAFASAANNLVPRDTNGTVDVFVYNRHMSLECAGGSLSAVGCLSGYGFKATSNKIGLEDFYPYHPFDLGSAQRALLNVHSGNLVVQATDLEVPGQGLNLRLTRTYNSQWDQGPGPLGRGWRIGIAEGDADDLLGSVVSAALSADVGQLLEVVATEDQFDFFDADGTRHHFVKGGLAGPGWHAPPGVNLTLSDHLVGAERRYRATRPDGVTYEFRPTAGSYALRSIADRKGNTLTFSYSSGRLSSITDSTGRSLSFSWSGDYLSSATFAGSGSSRTVNYSVDTFSGRLTSVSTGGRSVSYTYGIQGLATTKDGRNNTTTFTLNQGGMLTQLKDRANQTWNVAYNTNGCEPGSEEAVAAVCVTHPEGGVHTYTTSAQGNLLHSRDPGDTSRNVREYFWQANRLVWEVDAVGNPTEYAYNQNGQVILKRESGGDSSTTSVFTYRAISPGVAELVSARIGVGSGDERVWQFGLAENGDMRSVTDASGAVTVFEHYERGLLKSVTDPRGSVTMYGNGTASDGGYHGTGQPPSVTDANGQTVAFGYDFLGRLTSRVDRNGSTWSFAYDARGNLTSQSAPGAGTTTYAYDANDNLTSTTPPGGATTTNTYDARDLLTASQVTIDGTLRKTTFGYDKAGRVVEILEPRTFAGSPTVTQKVTYQHYPNGRVSAMVDEEGNRTDVTYTSDGYLRSVQRPSGTAGRHTTAYTYNRRGQVTSILESGHSSPTTHTYNQHGERVSTKSPKGAVTRFEYDKMGRLVKTTNPAGRASDRVYDPTGNLVRITQPAYSGGAITTSYSYTPRGEIASESDPADGAHVTAYEYDPEGRQRFRRDRYNGTVVRTVEQTYRADGAVLSRTASGSGRSTHVSSFTYDGAGNVTAANASLGGSSVSSVSVSYNGAFEPTSVSETISGVTKTTAYAYQPDGLLASRTIDGKTTTYTHARNGLETQVTPWGGLGSFTNTYLPNGALSATDFPNGMRAEHLYDAAERLASRMVRRTSSATSAVLSSWTGIAYDDDGHRTAETAAQAQPQGATVPAKSGTASYSYDALGRLTSAKHPFDGKPATYTLDDAGNVTRESGASSRADLYYYGNRLGAKWFEGTETTTENGATTTVDSSGRSVYSYDRLGDLTRAQTDMKSVATVTDGADNATVVDLPTISNITTTSYDAASHTRRVKESDGSYVEYTYDALDRLVRRVEQPASGSATTTLFFHDGTSEQVAIETSGSGSVQTRYLLDSAGFPLGQEGSSSSARSYFVDDPRGNVSQLVAHDGEVKAVFGYDAFGKERPAHTSSVGNWDSRLRFQMAPKDPKTGAYALGPRMYDPSINRFVGADHYVGATANMALAADPLTGNRYLYAGANPVGMIDDGHAPQYFAPTRWRVWVGYSWRAEWQFYPRTFRGIDCSYDSSLPHCHTGKARVDVDIRYVYVKITEGEMRGKSCDACWNALNDTVRETVERAYKAGFNAASRVINNAFANYLDNRSWQRNISLGALFKSVCSNPISRFALSVTSRYGAPIGTSTGYIFGGPAGGLTGTKIGVYAQVGAAGTQAACGFAT